jgi:hypothetical protein
VDTVTSWPETQRALGSTRPFKPSAGSSSSSGGSKVSAAVVRTWVDGIRRRLDVLVSAVL